LVAGSFTAGREWVRAPGRRGEPAIVCPGRIGENCRAGGTSFGSSISRIIS
jgi:hypothetical protein